MNKIFLPIDKRGASSVLIILMMVVLIVFGLAALTTSLATARLGDKANDWTGEYYVLEGDANEFLFELDGLLYDAETEAIEYIKQEQYAVTTETIFPANIQETIYSNYTYIIPETSAAEYLSRVFEAAYYKSAVDVLINAYPRAQFNYHGGYIRQILEDEGFSEILFTMTISEKNSEFAKNLDITVKLTAPSYKISIEDGKLSGTRARTFAGHYEILGWKEWQQYFDYSDKIEFEDIFDDAP